MSMDARLLRAVVTTALSLVAASTQAGGFRTTNFVVSAPTPSMAEQIGRAAERYRRDLAIEWLGKEMPTWAQPCPITAQVAPNLGAGGATSFLFDHGEVFGWRMTIQGSLERILDSVLPHEVTHTIFATHFRRPLPRWADEGACTTVEHQSERNKQQLMLVDFLRTGRGIPFSRMFAMRDYPSDVMPLYSQGYSLARFLIAQGGKQKFLAFVGDGLRDDQWPRAVERHYGFKDLGHLQSSWLEWVRQGSPAVNPTQPTLDDVPVLLAGNNTPPFAAKPKPTPRQAVSGAYPTDDDSPLVPVSRRGKNTPAPRTAAAPQARPVSWQPRTGALLPPDDHLQESVTLAEDAYARDESLPGPSNSESGGYQVTRPQPPEAARQVILEWSKS